MSPYVLLAWALVSGLVSHRLWRMAAVDQIFDRPRAHLPGTGFWRDLVDCPWCLGFWLNAGFAIILLAADRTEPLGAVFVTLAGSSITGVVGRGD